MLEQYLCTSKMVRKEMTNICFPTRDQAWCIDSSRSPVMFKDNAKLTLLMDQFQEYFSYKKYVTFGYLFLFITRYQTPADMQKQ